MLSKDQPNFSVCLLIIHTLKKNKTNIEKQTNKQKPSLLSPTILANFESELWLCKFSLYKGKQYHCNFLMLPDLSFSSCTLSFESVVENSCSAFYPACSNSDTLKLLVPVLLRGST